MPKTRNAFAITLSVWKALLLREGVRRFFGSRAAWLWLLLEPVAHIALLVVMFTVIRIRTVGGIDLVIWLVFGLIAFSLFRRTATQGMSAISANQGLFAYPQVKPIDTVFLRAFLEIFISMLVTVILLVILILLDRPVIPDQTLMVLQAMLGMWLVGVGFALIASVAVELVKELDNLVGLVMFPLYLLSGVIFPIASIPLPYREILLLNPLAHGVEAVRAGFSGYYHAFPELSLGYLYIWAVVLIFIGLVLQRRFAHRLVAL